MPEAFDLQRFLDAQATVYQNALSELRAGHKRTHWMWFIFPQVAGLGHSAMAQRYAISSRAEAQHYLEHPILAQRLRQCTEAVLSVEGKTALQIFGAPDDTKFRSSMTLFEAVSQDGLFGKALALFWRRARSGDTRLPQQSMSTEEGVNDSQAATGTDQR